MVLTITSRWQTQAVSVDEFGDFMANPQIRDFFELKGIHIKDTDTFFHMITTATGCTEVDLEAFVGACLKVRGPATSIGLHAMNFESKMAHLAQHNFRDDVRDSLARIERNMSLLAK